MNTSYFKEKCWLKSWKLYSSLSKKLQWEESYKLRGKCKPECDPNLDNVVKYSLLQVYLLAFTDMALRASMFLCWQSFPGVHPDTQLMLQQAALLHPPILSSALSPPNLTHLSSLAQLMLKDCLEEWSGWSLTLIYSSLFGWCHEWYQQLSCIS